MTHSRHVSGRRRCRHSLLLASILLAGCSSIQYTVDDGRQVDEKLLANIRAYGGGQRAIVPAIARSATLKDPECDSQWELPFSVATSYEWKEDDRVAWVRGLNVDERLSVIAAVPECGLASGDKIVDVDGYKSNNTEKMFTELMALRDRGRPFALQTAAAKTVTISPLNVCRGHVRLAPPNAAEAQDYHWEMSIHPLEVVKDGLSPDEALWVVLWTQGISEEGGARMKTFHYGKKVVSTLIDLATLVGGVTAVANAASTAAANAAAASAASSAAQSAVAKAIAQAAVNKIQEDAREAGLNALRDSVKSIAQRRMLGTLQDAAANRAGLSGIAWVAGTVFDQADQWAYRRMKTLGADPLAAFSLHYKLLTAESARNAFVLDQERLPLLVEEAKKDQREYAVASILRGVAPGVLELNLEDMPQASVELPTLMPGEKPEPALAQGFNLGGFIEAAADAPLAQQSHKKQ